MTAQRGEDGWWTQVVAPGGQSGWLFLPDAVFGGVSARAGLARRRWVRRPFWWALKISALGLVAVLLVAGIAKARSDTFDGGALALILGVVAGTGGAASCCATVGMLRFLVAMLRDQT